MFISFNKPVFIRPQPARSRPNKQISGHKHPLFTHRLNGHTAIEILCGTVGLLGLFTVNWMHFKESKILHALNNGLCVLHECVKGTTNIRRFLNYKILYSHIIFMKLLYSDCLSQMKQKMQRNNSNFVCRSPTLGVS